MLVQIGEQFTRTIGRSSLLLKKHSPKILLAVGIGSLVASTYIVWKRTLDEGYIFKTHHREVMAMTKRYWKEVDEGIIQLPPEEETGDSYAVAKFKDHWMVYSEFAADVARIYAPAIALGVVGISCCVGSHVIMNRRVAALITTYKTLDLAYKKYRERVVEEHGEMADYLYSNNLYAENVVETVKDEKTGKKKKKQSTRIHKGNDPNNYSEYARFFDETCSEWTKNADYNFFFLKGQQNYWNDMLRIKGHVFLNQVYDALGFEQTPAGALVGWIWKDDRENFIDFGVFDSTDRGARRFVNGVERSILLDFNVDGIIFDQI